MPGRHRKGPIESDSAKHDYAKGVLEKSERVPSLSGTGTADDSCVPSISYMERVAVGAGVFERS